MKYLLFVFVVLYLGFSLQEETNNKLLKIESFSSGFTIEKDMTGYLHIDNSSKKITFYTTWNGIEYTKVSHNIIKMDTDFEWLAILDNGHLLNLNYDSKGEKIIQGTYSEYIKKDSDGIESSGGYQLNFDPKFYCSQLIETKTKPNSSYGKSIDESLAIIDEIYILEEKCD